MQITIDISAGSQYIKPGRVRDWRRNPASIAAAAGAALHYARRDGKRYIVVPGNSYGHVCYHIADERDDVRRYVPGVGDRCVRVLVVDPSGQVDQADACR